MEQGFPHNWRADEAHCLACSRCNLTQPLSPGLEKYDQLNQYHNITVHYSKHMQDFHCYVFHHISLQTWKAKIIWATLHKHNAILMITGT